jgi:hypothetical protein
MLAAMPDTTSCVRSTAGTSTCRSTRICSVSSGLHQPLASSNSFAFCAQQEAAQQLGFTPVCGCANRPVGSHRLTTGSIHPHKQAEAAVASCTADTQQHTTIAALANWLLHFAHVCGCIRCLVDSHRLTTGLIHPHKQAEAEVSRYTADMQQHTTTAANPRHLHFTACVWPYPSPFDCHGQTSGVIDTAPQTGRSSVAPACETNWLRPGPPEPPGDWELVAGVASSVVLLPPVEELAAGRHPQAPPVIKNWSQVPKQVKQ